MNLIRRPSSGGLEDDDPMSHSVHAGNIPLLWMKQEAAKEGLVFKSEEEVAWVPGPLDVDLGRKESLISWWRFLEFLPTCHRVSFSGTGKRGFG